MFTIHQLTNNSGSALILFGFLVEFACSPLYSVGSGTPTTSHSPKTLFIRLTGDSKISHCPFSLLITFAFKTKSINKVFLIYLKTFQITYSAILRFSLCLPMQLHCVSTYRYNMYTFTAWFYFGVYEWGSTLMRSCPRNCLNVCLYTHLL